MAITACGPSPRTALATARSTPEFDPLTTEFIAAGIDDLAKYHVVRLLCKGHLLAGDGAYYAACLGFHSVQVTSSLLDELVASGIMVEESSPRAYRARYRLADDGALRRRLVRLYLSIRRQAGRDSLLRVLASRSLQKARARVLAAARDAHSGMSGQHRERAGQVGGGATRRPGGDGTAGVE